MANYEGDILDHEFIDGEILYHDEMNAILEKIKDNRDTLFWEDITTTQGGTEQ